MAEWTQPYLQLSNRHTGEILSLRRVQREGAVWLELNGSLPPHREGPPLHIHFLEDEEGHVTAGTLSVLVDGHTGEVQTGESTSLPRGVPHRWWNAGDQPLAFHGWAKPVIDLDRYLQAIFDVINAGPPGRPSLMYLAHVALRHRETQLVLVMPRPLQAIVFRLAVAVGTILGKYRGSDWPGAPARCLGAPLSPASSA